MIRLIHFFIVLTLFFTALAQESKSLDDYFSQLDLKKLQFQKKEIIFENKLKYEEFVQKSLWSDTPYKAVIKKGSEILDILTGTKFILTEAHFALAIRKKDDPHFIYCLDKKNGIRFRTEAINTKSIEADLDIAVRPKEYKEYQGPTEFTKTDNQLKIYAGLNYFFEQTRSPYLAQNYNIEGSGNNLGALLTLLFTEKLFFDPGFTFRVGQLNLNEIEGSNKTYSLGPMARFKIVHNHELSSAIDLMFEKALAKNIASDQFNSTSLASYIKIIFTGEMLNTELGISARYEWLSNNGDSSVNAHTDGNWNFGLTLGLGMRM